MEAEVIASTAIALRDRLLPQLGSESGLGLLDTFTRNAPAQGPLDHYKSFTPMGRQLIEQVELEKGEMGRRRFLRAAILHGLVQTMASERFDALPARVMRQQLSQFRRIVADQDVEADWLHIDHDLFHKEFAIATLRLYVAGAQLVDPHCGVPRSLMLRSSPLNWLRNIAAIVQLGGFQPYFQIHTHQFMLETFNQAGWDECYRCCADLYDIHPEVLGMYGSSWFYDPDLSRVSPRLSYLREVPQQAGAHLFYVETGGGAMHNALSTSPTRRQLYETGEYMPKTFMLLWGKKTQRAWAHSMPSSHTVAI